MTDAPVERLDPVTGQVGDVTVTVTGLSFRPVNGARHYPYDDFGSDFIEALHEALAAPRRRGLIRSTLVCPVCDTSLEDTEIGPTTVETELVLTRVTPVWVDVQMPGMTCPGCRSPLVRIDDRAIESDLSDALIAAMTSGGLVPG